MVNTSYDIYKIICFYKGIIKSSELISSGYKSLKEARKECKKEHYSWPYYHILRRNNQGELIYKP